MRLAYKLFAILILSLNVSCANAQEPMRLPVHEIKLAVQSDGQDLTSFDIEIATTDEEKSAGLMHRTDLPLDRGMLFIFDDVSERFFWMKNTPTPLDIIYADQFGKIVHIAENTVPFSTNAIPSRLPAKFAFEIHAGLSDKIGISAGDHLVHPIIDKD